MPVYDPNQPLVNVSVPIPEPIAPKQPAPQPQVQQQQPQQAQSRQTPHSLIFPWSVSQPQTPPQQGQ